MTDSTGIEPDFRNRGLILPFVRPLYTSLHEVAETVLRVVAGAALVTHGIGKVSDPFGASEMVESLGFYPGAFWSPLLSFTEFLSGIFVAIGLLDPARFVRRAVHPAGDRLVPLGDAGPGLSGRREVDPLGSDLLLLRCARRQPPFGRRRDRQAVLNLLQRGPSTAGLRVAARPPHQPKVK